MKEMRFPEAGHGLRAECVGKIGHTALIAFCRLRPSKDEKGEAVR